ncbi:general stress protein [Staphylococcus caledonicus]|uniref:general stress protein n=1 Tax=Staphylococcus caledonicus TaxID=2741333 RepID=UPI0018E4701D|nr:general stress protein [Staphylococcus caledonicus]MBI5973490.1 general stress protein [Staphylococcus caledonicus]
MADFTVLDKQDEIYNVIEKKKAEGYSENELVVVSKSKLHLDDLHNSQITLIATSGSFSDRMSRLLTGEDGEEAVLTRFNLTEDRLEEYKQEVLKGKYLVVANKDNTSHNEVEENNSAYEEIDITHYANESKGPKS